MENDFLKVTRNAVTYELDGQKKSYFVINHNTNEKKKIPTHIAKLLVLAFFINRPISKEMLWESLNDFWQGEKEITFTFARAEPCTQVSPKTD